MQPFEVELRQKTKVSPAKKEARPDYLTRLVEAINNLEDDTWASLSKEAQKWSNVALKAHRAQKEIPDFPEETTSGRSKSAKREVVEEEKEQEEEVGEETEQEHSSDRQGEGEEEEAGEPASGETTKRKERPMAVAKKKKKARAAEKPAVVKKAASNGSGRALGSLGGTAQTAIKKIMLRNPSISKEDLGVQLQKRGLKCSDFTITSVRSDFRHSLKVLATEGELKREFDL